MDTNKKFTPVEVAESLLKCASPVPCEGCIAIDRHNDCDCADFLKRTAADMIKELAAEVAQLRGELILKNNELLKLREENQWISVADGLPGAAPDPDESKDIVLVSYTFWNGDIYTTPAYHDGKNWHWWAADYGTLYCDNVADTSEATITHWKPMPKRTEEKGGCDHGADCKSKIPL